MKDYPRLTEMGVLHPGQIDRYSVNSIDYTDVLRIVYRRPRGSVLPESRTYKFPRVQRSRSLRSGDTKAEVVMESDPCLREALEELADIMAERKEEKDVATALLDEVRHLEDEVAARVEALREQITKLQAS